ncbi:MAG: Hsp20/alpha crystallin family protein [Niabella sp.]
MTNVTLFNGKPTERSFSSLVDELFNNAPAIFNAAGSSGRRAPVNITEKENAYEIEVSAPGFDKADFKINIDNNLLTISAEKNAETENKTERKIVREFHHSSFKRSFTIDEKVDSDKIDAEYVNGILKVTLGKKESQKATSKEIEVK